MAGRTNTALPFYCIKFYGNPLSPCFVSSMPYLLMPVKAFSLGFKWMPGRCQTTPQAYILFHSPVPSGTLFHSPRSFRAFPGILLLRPQFLCRCL